MAYITYNTAAHDLPDIYAHPLRPAALGLGYIPYSGLFSRGKIFTNARCGDVSRVKFLRMVNKELINNHTPIYFQGENIRE